MAVAKVGWKKKAPRDKADKEVGRRSRGHLSSSTLGMALSQLVRLPKPRSSVEVDDIVRAAARATAEEELVKELEIEMKCEDYYLKM